MNTILTSLYYIVENGSHALLDQIMKIDDQFVTSIIAHGDSIINLILLVTLVCCGVILILTTFFIPYFLGVEAILK